MLELLAVTLFARATPIITNHNVSIVVVASVITIVSTITLRSFINNNPTAPFRLASQSFQELGIIVTDE